MHGVPVDDDLAHVGHVAAALVIVDEDGDDADVLKLRKVQFDLVLAGGLLLGERHRLRRFFPQLSNERLGLLTNTLTFFGAVPSAGPRMIKEVRLTSCRKGMVTMSCSSSSDWQSSPASSLYPGLTALLHSLPVAWRS